MKALVAKAIRTLQFQFCVLDTKIEEGYSEITVANDPHEDAKTLGVSIFHDAQIWQLWDSDFEYAISREFEFKDNLALIQLETILGEQLC